jgi:hypothetical protein
MNYVWVVVHHDFPSLPHVRRYVLVRTTPKGVVVSEWGREQLIQDSSFRTVFTDEAAAKDEWYARLWKYQDRLSALAVEFDVPCKRGFSPEVVPHEPPPAPKEGWLDND